MDKHCIVATQLKDALCAAFRVFQNLKIEPYFWWPEGWKKYYWCLPCINLVSCMKALKDFVLFCRCQIHYKSWITLLWNSMEGDTLNGCFIQESTYKRRGYDIQSIHPLRINLLTRHMRHIHRSSYFDTSAIRFRRSIQVWIMSANSGPCLKSVLVTSRILNRSEAEYVWTHLRFSDYKMVNEYNSALRRIVNDMRYCGVNLTEAQLVEKTLSTMPPEARVL